MRKYNPNDEPNWIDPFGPFAHGKQFVILDSVWEYEHQRCIDPIHIFRDQDYPCKCRAYYWKHPQEYTQSRTIQVQRND